MIIIKRVVMLGVLTFQREARNYLSKLSWF